MPMTTTEEYPRANAFHERILRLPVWDDDASRAVEDQYVAAFRKVWSELERSGGLARG